MGPYTIGDVAERSGFTVTALRYYEGIGLVAPAARSAAGYRIYDHRTLERLAFIKRAKQLGCSLEEITDLVEIWESERCGPMQRRFHALVTEKIHEAGRQITELTGFSGQLRAAAAQLSGPAVDGPCGNDCACLAGEALTPCAPGGSSPPGDGGDPPVACTLGTESVPVRLAQWHAILDHTVSRTTAHDGALRLEFADAGHLGELVRLVAAEQDCCAFFAFTITVDGRGIALEVRAPDDASDIVSALFGSAVDAG